MFSSQSHCRVMQTRYHLATLKKGNMSIPDYFQKAKSYANLLASIGQSINDNDLITQILAGLPLDYNDLATVPDLEIPMANLAAKTFNPTPHGRQFQYSSNQSSNGSRGRGRNNSSCGRGNGGSSSSVANSNNSSSPSCQICFKPHHPPLIWYPDTGANNHLTTDLSHLNLNVDQYTGHDQVRIGNGQGQNSSQLISLPSLKNFTRTSTPSPQNSDSRPLLNTNPPTPPFLDSPPIPPLNTTSHSHHLPHVSTSPISTQCPTSPTYNIQLHSNDATNPHMSSNPIYPVSSNPPANNVNLQSHAHPMQTRSRDNIVQPKQFYPSIIRYPLPKAFLTVTSSLPPEPSCFTEASKSPEWRATMNTEFTALLKNFTWSLVQPKPNTNIVGCKWVFRIKCNATRTIESYIRTVLSLAVASNWDIRQLDVTNAFLHGVLLEDVYMTQPPGLVHPSYPHHVCHLCKALYGLKQAPRAWYSRLSTRLLDLGFKGCKSDTSLFIHRSGTELILFLIYMDDIIITGTNSISIAHLIKTLQGDFTLKDLRPFHFFLGVEYHKVDSSMYLSQCRYIIDLLRKTNLHEAKPVSSPMASSTVLNQYTGSSLSDLSSYCNVVGSLQYLSLTRPDISFAVNKVCQFMANPTEDHWSAPSLMLIGQVVRMIAIPPPATACILVAI
uniref:Reverse transcriptase Ty1/copia-type domain-containing protein n=1 Tax=Fagus sylvatica TaxID=28930 RepID=A0A2N9IQ78_FAGSY